MQISGGIRDGDIVCSICKRNLQDCWAISHNGDGTHKLEIRPHHCKPTDPVIALVIEKLEGLVKTLKKRKGTYTV
jgi:hypothetical protein